MTVLVKLILLINVVAFLLMGYDKRQAKERGWRVSEKMLMTMAVLMGAGGIFAGMYVFRHKTKHSLFKYGVPLLLGCNILVLYYWLKVFNK